jgi:hypothetical protein
MGEFLNAANPDNYRDLKHQITARVIHHGFGGLELWWRMNRKARISLW